MCFNKESSLTFFIFGTVCSIYIINRGIKTKNNDDIASGVLLLFISFMQLIEFYLWINQTCNKVNRLMSLLIIVLLWAQPLSLYISSTILNNKNPPVYHYILITIWCVGCALWLISGYQKNKMCSLADKDTCRLIWEPLVDLFENNTLLAIILFILYFTVYIISPCKKLSNYFYVLIPSILISTIYYKKEKFYSIFGSVFCFTGVFFGIFRLLNK